jgi:hypothetical protein
VAHCKEVAIVTGSLGNDGLAEASRLAHEGFALAATPPQASPCLTGTATLRQKVTSWTKRDHKFEFGGYSDPASRKSRA